MREVVLSYSQSKTRVGIRNVVELHLKNIEYETDVLQFDYLHVDEQTLAEPASLDGYLFGFITFAMQHADRFTIRGPVTQTAIRNAQIYGEAWHAWLPRRFTPVEVNPERVVTDMEIARRRSARQSSSHAIAAFSGGVDATFLALRHARDMGGPTSFEISDVAIVHGFDVLPENDLGFQALLERTAPLLDHLDLRPRVVRTNVRKRAAHAWEHQKWEQSFGSQLAGVLHQFSGQFDHGLVASSEPYNHPVNARGSSPSIDYLLSGSDFQIIHEGAGFSRTEKVERIGADPIARRTVKVCWEGSAQGENCGHCEKCVRTRLNFAAIGDYNPPCFHTPFDPAAIRSLRIEARVHLTELATIVEYADEHGNTDPWLRALRRRVRVLERTLAIDAFGEETVKPRRWPFARTPGRG